LPTPEFADSQRLAEEIRSQDFSDLPPIEEDPLPDDESLPEAYPIVANTSDSSAQQLGATTGSLIASVPPMRSSPPRVSSGDLPSTEQVAWAEEDEMDFNPTSEYNPATDNS
jgi:hypothetical protein